MKTFIIFLFLFNLINALPIFPSSSIKSSSSSSTTQPSSFALISSTILTSTILKDKHNTQQLTEQDIEEEYTQPEDTSINSTLIDTKEEQCPNSEYGIPVERFAQLVSTHWQFDHLDSIKSGAYKVISEQFQEHIQINIEPIATQEQAFTNSDTNNRQRSFQSISNTWDLMMDLEILHAQIFGAIQAHTEGSLHIAWDRLSDKLGQPAFEQFIRLTALKYCTLDKEQNLLSSTCLKEKAIEISLELDEYININLNNVFIALENDILPNLLSNTSKDLKGVLDYFNRLFLLKDNQHLLLKVSTWSSSENSSLQSKLKPLLNKSVDEHLHDFFKNYACLSRA